VRGEPQLYAEPSHGGRHSAELQRRFVAEICQRWGWHTATEASKQLNAERRSVINHATSGSIGGKVQRSGRRSLRPIWVFSDAEIEAIGERIRGSEPAQRARLGWRLADGPGSALLERASPDVRRKWGRVKGGLRPTAVKRGRRPGFTEAQAQRALELRLKNWSLGRIANATGLTKSQVQWILKSRDRIESLDEAV
jgi:hypothetical protein